MGSHWLESCWQVSSISLAIPPTGTTQTAAKELLDSILDIVVRIFENHAVVRAFGIKSHPS